MSIVVPAILPSSREDLVRKLSAFETASSVECVQIDVVDGKFATPASWPYNAVGEFSTLATEAGLLPHPDRVAYEIDLMVLDAEIAAAAWLSLGASRLTFHAESTADLPRLLAFARDRYGDGDVVSFGLALNIESDLALIEPCITKVQYVQFMGIARIGRQGQPFDERVYEKVRVFRSRHPHIPIQVDGGISLENAKKLLSLGVSRLVIGSNLLRAGDPVTAIAAFEALAAPYAVY